MAWCGEAGASDHAGAFEGKAGGPQGGASVGGDAGEGAGGREAFQVAAVKVGAAGEVGKVGERAAFGAGVGELRIPV